MANIAQKDWSTSPHAIFYLETNLWVLYLPYNMSEGCALSVIENLNYNLWQKKLEHSKQLENLLSSLDTAYLLSYEAFRPSSTSNQDTR